MRADIKYAAIEKNCGRYPISAMCKFFKVLQNGYYAYLKRSLSHEESRLAGLIRECQRQTHNAYGYRRVGIWLERRGINYPYRIRSGVSVGHTRPLQPKYRGASHRHRAINPFGIEYDQGFQYTSHGYSALTQTYGITPSMSRRANPYDNAMAENFFSILKSECLRRRKPKTIAQAKELIDDYIYFYNNERIQLKTKQTPLEKRRLFK